MDEKLLCLAEIFADLELSYLREILQTDAKGDLEKAIELLLEPKDITKYSSRQTFLEEYITLPSKNDSVSFVDLEADELDFKIKSEHLYKIEQDEISTTSVNKKRSNPVSKSEIEFSEAYKKSAKRTTNKATFLYSPREVSFALPSVTFHTNFLSPDLALKLLDEVLDESKSWYRYRMFLFDREVESPHLTSSYCSSISGNFPKGEFFFNGKPSHPYEVFSPTMENVASVIQDFINAESLKRPRHKLDLPEDHPWKANFAVVNLYETTKASVGWHTDRLTYLGVRPIIVSLSLGVTREFRLRKVIPGSDTTVYSIPLPHNSLLIMWGPTQEEYKHCVPPQLTLTPHPKTGFRRLNFTFRYYPASFGPENTPKCFCDIPCDLRVVNLDAANLGRYFWKCAKPDADGSKGCGFFRYVSF